MKIQNYEDETANSRVADVVSLNGRQNLSNKPCRAAPKPDKQHFHITLVVNMISFIVILIFFSTFSVSCWRPCWCWRRVFREMMSFNDSLTQNNMIIYFNYVKLWLSWLAKSFILTNMCVNHGTIKTRLKKSLSVHDPWTEVPLYKVRWLHLDTVLTARCW